MPSSYTASLRFEKQFTGENINVWGERLNTALERIDFSIAGFTSIALTGDMSLSSSNTADDQARSAMLKFTGGAGPFTVTIPSLSKSYRIWNATAGVVTVTTGAGGTVQIDATDIVDLFCDGANVKPMGYSGLPLKAYIAAVAGGGPGSTVPSVTGNSGKYLTNNGATTLWQFPVTADLADLAAYTAARNAFAVAMAVAFSSAQ